MSLSKKIGVIGTGRVGTTIGYNLKKSGHQIIGAADLKQKNVRQFCQILKLKYRKLSNVDIANKANLIFITTQDAAVEKVYCQILPYLKKGTVLVQCSGALSNTIFKKARKKRIIVIGLHPIQTFATIRQSIKATKNIYYAVEAEPKARPIARKLVAALHGNPVYITSKDKPLYHAMCVFASNYLVSLMSAVLDIALALKIRPNLAFTMLEPLIKQTLDNIQKDGIEKSLTGPIMRGDIETIKSHLKILEKKLPHLLPLYQTLGLKALSLLITKSA
ncbi:MAG: DUF2520 domain-containing protein [Candidatus Latescibacteria bacterium]|nr:DUF2520 domain-containing protein [Candidatus Latescibacterota bacterium]